MSETQTGTKKINLKKIVEFNGKTFGTVGESIAVALGNSRSMDDKELILKHTILEKIKGEQIDSFTSDEIVQIKKNAREILTDFATIAIIKEIAPNDLKS